MTANNGCPRAGRGANQRAGTWHELRGSSARHWPMKHGRDRGAAEAANSARHGGECNLPAHHQRSGGVGSTHAQPCIRSRRVDCRQACRYEIGLEAGVAPGPLHQKPAALLPALESAHSLLTAIGGRLCSMGENGQYPLLTPASLHNGCEQTKPVSGSLFKVRPTLACREKASLHSRTPRSIARCIRACAAAQDGRGRWRERDACAVELAVTGSAATAIACAAAAERLGAWLRAAHARASAAVRAAA